MASVIAIRGGFMVYVGDSVSVRSASSPGTRRSSTCTAGWRCRGSSTATTTSSCIGNRPGHHTPLENAYSIADVQALYAAAGARRSPKSPNPPTSAANFITTIGGFSPNQFKEGRLPTLAELDAAVPHQPVFIKVGLHRPGRHQLPRQGLLR